MGARTTGTYVTFDLPLFLPLRSYFRTTCATFIRAATHEDLTGLPVDLWVVLLKPCEPKYNVLFPKTSDCEGSPLRVAIVTENCIYDFRDRPSLVRTSVHIEHRYRTVELLGGEPVPLHIRTVHELSSGSAVHECGTGLDFRRVRCLDLYLDE
jgi:hypothetical protein